MARFPSVVYDNGALRAGRIHTLTFSDYPFKERKYVKIYNVNVDSNLRDCGVNIMKFLNAVGVKFMTLGRNNIVEGRSWEMSAVEAVLGGNGIYSGTVEEYSNDEITYGHVPGLAIKKRINSDILSAYDINGRLLSR